MKKMQKVLFIIGVCILGTFIYWKAAKSFPVTNDLLLKNVEALAMEENSLPIICRDSGNFICPGNGVRVAEVYMGYGLKLDEETY